mgnify:CR=1 FL=1|jgi:hypothetical protein
MLGKIIGLFISLIGLLLPWRLRILFSEFLGWVTQLIYYTYYGIFNYILKELRESVDKVDKDES